MTTEPTAPGTLAAVSSSTLRPTLTRASVPAPTGIPDSMIAIAIGDVSHLGSIASHEGRLLDAVP